MTIPAPAMPAACTPLTLDSIATLAAAIEHTRGVPLTIGESSTLKTRYHHARRRNGGAATIADVCGVVALLVGASGVGAAA